MERLYNWEIEEGHLLGFYASLLHVTSDNVPALKRYAGS